METPKKVVEAVVRMLYLCYSCNEERKVVYFRKIANRLLQNYQLRIKCGCTKLLCERPVVQFICRGQYYQRLTTCKRALDNINKAKGEIKEVFKANVHRTKRLRRKENERKTSRKRLTNS